MFVRCALIVVLGGSARAADAPLADAAEKADWKRVESLLQSKAAASQAQADGMTALHWACHHDHTPMVKRLLEVGADPKVATRLDITPLSLAATNGNGEIVRLLLAAGADPKTTLRGGETVLMTAARTGKPEAVDALLQAGADVNARDRKGQTSLMWAAAAGHAPVVRRLLDAKAEIHHRLPSGYTAMLFAVREGRIDVVKLFLNAGVSADEAIRTERKGGGFSAPNGLSALNLAVENGHFELALHLLKAGADPNDQRAGYAPLHRLSWVRRPNRGDDPDGLPPPVGSGSVTSLQMARLLIDHGAKVNLPLTKGPSGKGKLNHTGATPFLLAAVTADLPYLKLLIEAGADPKLPNADGATPLMAAAGLGCLTPDEVAGTEAECLAAVEYLISLGCDVNTVDRNGETAMHGAAYKSLPKMVAYLAGRGAKIDVWNRKNKYGWTPLIIAEGFRPGNFKPSVETIAAIHTVMRSAGVTPPPPTPRTGAEAGYEPPPAKKP